MWEANTIQIPKELVKKVMSNQVSSDALFAFCLQEMYPRRTMKEIAGKYDIEKSDAKAASAYAGDSDSGQSEERKRPQRRNQSGSGEQKQYEKSPESPAKFKAWLRKQVDEALPESFEVRDGAADAIYDKSGGDKQYILDAIETTRDYHENKEEVRSPGAVILSQITRFDADKLHSMAEAVRRNGTVVKNRSQRMNRASERAEEYIRASGNEIQRDDDFFDEEEEEFDE